MAIGSFTSCIEYQRVKLFCPSDIVQHSFIVQNSISHLDLEVSQSYRLTDLEVSQSYRLMTSFLDYCPIYSSYSMINTEEKCQKYHSRSRKLLYNLHLDLPKAREWSLKSESLPKNLALSTDSPCLARIEICADFYFNISRNFVYYACINTDLKENVLKWFMKLDELKYHKSLHMPSSVLKHFVDRMLVEFTDSEFVEKCLTKLDFINFLRQNEKPGRVRDILYLVHRNDGKLERKIWRCDFSDRCFVHPSFMYVGEVLKFLNSPHLCKHFIDVFFFGLKMLHFSHSFPLGPVMRTWRRKGKRRCALLLHLYWTYLSKSRNPSAASESLRLVWNSVHDSFMTCNEITADYQFLGPEDISGIYDFYSKAVGKYDEDSKPRSLKHHCRSTIRYRLWKSIQWLPEGIERLGLPPKLQSYLKLEK